MKKQIKESINELYTEQLQQQNATKSIRRRKKLQTFITLFVTTVVALFTVILLLKAPNSQNEEVINNTITLDTMKDTEVKKNGTVTINDENDIQYLEEVFLLAEQISGIANMAVPQYKIRLGADGELFYLWFNEDSSATLMKSTDTHTIYKIHSAEKIEEIIQGSLAFTQFMDEINWETGMVSMAEPFDLTFTSDTTKYQLWLNEKDQTVTLVPVENNVNRWVSLNEKDSATLMNFLETSNNDRPINELTLQQIEEIDSLLSDVKWEMIKVDMAHEPDFKTKQYLLWRTPSNDQFEVIQIQGGYAKLSKEKSTLIFTILKATPNGQL